jgi:hypothetical protein
VVVKTADYCTVTPHGKIVSSKESDRVSKSIVRLPETNVFRCETCGACCSSCRYLVGIIGENPSCSLGNKKPSLCTSEEWKPGSPNCVASRSSIFGLDSEKVRAETSPLPEGSIS